MSHEKQLPVRKSTRMIALFSILLLSAVMGWAQAGHRPNRITQDLTTGGMIPLPGSIHRLAQRATDLGEVSSSMELGSMTMHFGLSPEQQSELDALLAAQQDPKSALYHHWLTQEEYAARFGLTDADLQQVTRWLESQGLSVQEIAKTRNSVRFSGQAWQVESAFQTQLHRFQWQGREQFANATELQIPAALRGVLLVVRGLNSFKPKPQLRRPAYTLNTTQGVMNFLSPADWATIYDVNALFSAGLTGTNAYVGVVGQTYAPQTDIDHFRSAAGLSTTKLTYVCIYPSIATANNGAGTTCTNSAAISTTGDLGEADLDIEWAGGIAKDATVVYIYAPYSETGTTDSTNSTKSGFPLNYDVFDALYDAVNNYTVRATGKVLPVISMSYTDCEKSVNGNAAYSNWISQMGRQANAQGQTIVVSTGDTGAAGCEAQTETVATQGEWVTVPVDSPAFTGVGGTTLSGDENDPTLFWTETNKLVSSAKSYIPETVWNDTSSAGLSTTGSGVSQIRNSSGNLIFPKPSWQPVPSGFTGTVARFVPDVSFAASPEHDGYLTCSSDPQAPTGDCSNGFISSGGFLDIVGGTSTGAPAFAGMLTLLVQKFGPQGNINPMLYEMASDPGTYASVFHDTTTGNNNIPCLAGTQGCVGGSSGTPGTMGFSASTGYDLATGLGSVDGGGLLAAMAAPGTTAATTTQLTVSPTTAQLGSTSVTLTAKVTSATAGTINGQLTFTVNGTTLGQATLSGGTATLSNVLVSSAHGFTAGNNTIQAQFAGGDSFFAPSTGTAVLPVSSSTQPPLSMTASATTVTVQPGAQTSVTLNLVSTTYAGTISFSVSSSSSLISASAPDVVMTAGGNQSATVTITAAQNASNHSPALPWKSGGAILFATLLASPFTLRKRSATAILLLMLAILSFGLLTSCGGGGSSGSSSSSSGAHTYTVTVTPSPSPATSPALSPVRITVSVP